MIKGEKLRALLGVLLLQAGRPVSIDRLLGALWGARPPASAQANLRTYAYQLRKVLGSPGCPRLTTRPSAYQIDASTAELDLLEFEALSDAGAEALHRGESEVANDQLSAALRLWRGHPLEGQCLETWVRGRLTALDDRHQATMSAWVEANLALGRQEVLIPQLREVVADNPLSERGWIQLIRALYESGRTGDALEAYARARQVLAEELGLEPGPDLRRMQASILRRGAVRPAVTGPPAPGAELPEDIACFAGRRGLRELVVELGRSVARRSEPAPPVVLSIAGGPGIGKSAFAVKLAHDLRPLFPDGASHLSPSAGRASTPTGRRRPDSGLDPELIERCRTWLRVGRVLLVADEASDADVAALLPERGDSMVLVASRTGLSPDRSCPRIDLRPLRLTEGAEMLAAIVGRPRVAAEGGAARRIVEACDGVPLAIRIAGVRLVENPDLTLAELAQRLNVSGRRLDELALGSTLRASLHRSYQQLSPVTRRTLHGLAVLRQRYVTVPTLAELLRLSRADARQVIDELAHHHLLDPITPKGPPCRIGALLLDYAHERAEPRDEVGTAV